MYIDFGSDDPHAYLHEQRYDNHQRRDDEAMEHGPDAGLLHTGEGGVQADGRQCADYQELAGALGGAHYLSRNGEYACYDGHGQEAQDEPGEDLFDGELRLERAAILLQGELTIAFPQLPYAAVFHLFFA